MRHSCEIPCDINVRALSHTWLGKRLLKGLQLNRDRWLDAGGDSLPRVLAVLPARTQEARLLASQLIDGYSPLHLVERGPLTILPGQVKAMIKEAIHHAYLDLGIMQPLTVEVTDAAADLGTVTSELSLAWCDPSSARRRAEILDALRVVAERLKRALDALPYGVVLP